MIRVTRVMHQNFAALVVVGFTNKIKRADKQKKTKQQVKQTHNHLVSTYCVILVNVELWRVEINNIMRIIKHEHDEYFKL